jgi:hypothetical protein
VFQPGASALAAETPACGREEIAGRKALASGLMLNRMVKVVQVFQPEASARAADTPACGRERNASLRPGNDRRDQIIALARDRRIVIA